MTDEETKQATLALLRQASAYTVLHTVAQYIHGELADHPNFDSRPDLRGRFKKVGTNAADCANQMLF